MALVPRLSRRWTQFTRRTSTTTTMPPGCSQCPSSVRHTHAGPLRFAPALRPRRRRRSHLGCGEENDDDDDVAGPWPFVRLAVTSCEYRYSTRTTRTNADEESAVGRVMMKRAMAMRSEHSAAIAGDDDDDDDDDDDVGDEVMRAEMREIEIGTYPSGKPYFVNPGIGGGCAVSVSHSAGIVATVIGPSRRDGDNDAAREVGVDVELEDRRMRIPVWRRFREPERAFVESGRLMETPESADDAIGDPAALHRVDAGEGVFSPAQLRRFLLLWTIKEAVAKKRGSGIDLEKIGSIRVGIGGQRHAGTRTVPSSRSDDDVPDSCAHSDSCASSSTTPDHHLAVHIVDSDEQVLVVRVTDARVLGPSSAIVAVCADAAPGLGTSRAKLVFQAEYVRDVSRRDSDELGCEVLAMSDGWHL